MTKYLITPSLLGSFSWYLSDESKDARQKFLNTLDKVRTETTLAQQKGIDFESNIEKCCDFPDPYAMFPVGGATPYDDCIIAIANIVKGGLWQQSVKKDLRIGNQDFILYGRTDVIKRDTIYDIKFTSNYELGKFLDSSQHLIYLYCSGLPKFSYLISDGKDWWREDYYNDGNTENRIKSMISDFLGYLENDKEAKEIFFSKWESKY